VRAAALGASTDWVDYAHSSAAKGGAPPAPEIWLRELERLASDRKFGPPFTQRPFNWQVFDFEGGPYPGFPRSLPESAQHSTAELPPQPRPDQERSGADGPGADGGADRLPRLSQVLVPG
jgi:hypothetical protein